MLNIQWTNILIQESKLANDAVENLLIKDFVTFSLKLRSLPISNKTVVRMFSKITGKM